MCRIASVLALILCAGAVAWGDPPIMDSGPFASGKVIQADGGTVAARVLKKVSFDEVTDQIRFDVQVLRVDNEMRDKIYQQLGFENVRTQITKVDDRSVEEGTQSIEPNLGSQHKTTTGSVVTTAIMTKEQHAELLQMVENSESCSVVARPRMIAGGGQVAAIQQQVQRPFLAELEEVKSGDETAIQSGIQVLNEGTDFIVQGDIDGDAVQVRANIQQSKIADVEQHSVYGVGERQHMIQLPTHEIRVATASERLQSQQTLLLDPYFQSQQQQHSTVGTPILDSVPYFGRSFKKTSIESVTTNLLVLVTARKL